MTSPLFLYIHQHFQVIFRAHHIEQSPVVFRAHHLAQSPVVFLAHHIAQPQVVTGSNAFGKEGQELLDGFGTVVNALGEWWKPYHKQIAGTIKWRFNNKAPSIQMKAHKWLRSWMLSLHGQIIWKFQIFTKSSESLGSINCQLVGI